LFCCLPRIICIGTFHPNDANAILEQLLQSGCSFLFPKIEKEDYPMLRKQPTTLAECNAELELVQKQLRQYQNREKMLTRKLSVEERRIRTHRLCARGGYLESIVPELIAMTDEEAKDYLYHAVHSEEAKAFLKKRAEGGVTE
ncbi:DUF3847 domain-containing protein, partial [Streptococcus alactolyticus]|uniref:DUF3847 domain-containing protein n=2 Tax=Streptococcus alactolyticus TaxID=29389 RepID=UPI003D088F49